MKAIAKGVVIGGAGALLLGASLALSSATVVSSASRAHPEGSITCKKSGSCLSVTNTGGGDAIGATGFTGIFGTATGSNGSGVNGEGGASADGVYGNSTAGTGVFGNSSSGPGVQGISSSYIGVYGFSAGSTAAAEFESNSEAATLYVQNDDAAYGVPLQVGTSAADDLFNVDAGGDGYFAGYVYATGFEKGQQERGGSQVEAFSPESTRATIEDTGTARLDGGEGAVRFDSAFANSIDTARGYQVFLTPDGETRGWLYIAAKYEGGFIVREAEHGRSSISFDYRVVAHPYGASDARLPQLNLKRPPIPHLPRHVRPLQPSQP